MDTKKVAKGLGWFSIGLGLAEVFATKPLGRILGMENHPKLLRVFGLREIGAGVGLLSRSRLAPWLWARVAGDALDLAMLSSALVAGTKRRNAGIATGAVAGVAALDIITGRRLSSATA